jgi:hypothetical protein
MLLLLALQLALAADPPAPPPAASPGGVTGTDALRRTCASAQLCDGKCIPWSDTCASTVRAQVETLQKADSDAQRVAIICAAAPGPSSAPVDTAVHGVQAASAFSLCTGEKGNEIENCKQDPTGRDLLPEAPTSKGSPCGEAPPTDPTAAHAPR